MIRIVDPYLFMAEAVHIDWMVQARRRGRKIVDDERSRLTVAIRWHVAAHRGNFDGDKELGIGLPTGPFTVWRRPSFGSEFEHEVGFEVRRPFLFSAPIVILGERVAMARVTVNSGGGGVVFGLADPSEPWSIVTMSVAPAGVTTIEVHGAGIAALLVPDDMTVLKVFGVSVVDYSDIGDWEVVEIVGLPVDPADWAGVGDHAVDQGLIAELGDPRDAARARLERGGPRFGWDDDVTAGVQAPIWEPADHDGVIKDVTANLLPHLRDALAEQQIHQMLKTIGISVPPPSTLDGATMSGDPTDAHVAPIKVLQVGVATDPYLSLALGYGTNLDETKDVDVHPFHDGSRFDYMVTAPFAKGLDGTSDAVELVAYALRPISAIRPPSPSNLVAQHRGFESPPTDGDWGASTIVRWERPPKSTLVRAASYAAARHDLGNVQAEALMIERGYGGHRPIAAARSQTDPEGNLNHVTDTRMFIANNPGTRHVAYSVATQDLFGLWSPWRNADHAAVQPAPTPPIIVSSRLDFVAPPTGAVCAGTLVVDFTCDWSVRRPRRIQLFGRLFAAATRNTPVPIAAAPGGLQRTIGGADPAVVVEFTGDTATVDGLITSRLQYLNTAGDLEVSAGPAQSNDIRRYRLTVPGFTVDYSTTPHSGLALWVRCDERRVPHHLSVTTGPVVTHQSDPVPRPMSPPIVPLGSLPDAEGRSHGKLSWPSVPGANGYHVYESDEFTMLAHYGLAEPDPDATLSSRFAVVLAAWNNDPQRRPFTRLTDRAVTGTSLDVAMAKGSRAIHAYAVVTAGPGGVEGPWPTPANASSALMSLAAPRLATPTPLDLLARASHTPGVVDIELTTRPGHAVHRIELHRVRVDDAARDFETMGPPVATVMIGGGAGWTSTTGPDGLRHLRGADSPGVSWRRVWYRAVAWGQPDGLRGLVSARSEPSNPFSLVVPPDGPPPLSAVTLLWPGGSAADVEARFTADVPVWRTALGPHRLELRLDDVTDPSTPTILVDLRADLDRLPIVPPATGSGWWRVDGSHPGDYRVLLRRTSSSQVLRGTVRLIDPLGRIAQQRIDIEAGEILPAPDLSALTVSSHAGGLIVVSFTSTSPNTPSPIGAYMLRVSAARRSGLGPFPPGRPLRPDFPFPPIVGRTVVVELPLPDIPVVNRIPPGSEPIVLVRQRGTGRDVSYAAVIRVDVRGVSVRLLSPDGRVATQTVVI